MQPQDYLKQYDFLANEKALLQIPIRKDLILRRVGAGKRVLHVGCLGGALSREIQNRNNEVIALEINPKVAKQARDKGVQVFEQNAEDPFEFESNSFDVVLAPDIMEHLYDTQAFLKQVSRVLIPGGVLILSVPNVNCLENRWRVLRGDFPKMLGTYPEDHYGCNIRTYNLQRLRELCKIVGFELENIQGLPVSRSHGKFLDRSFQFLGKVFPSMSQRLLIVARKPDRL